MPDQSPVSQDPFDEFPAQVREDIDGLMWLGYLEDSFDYAGHSFIIRTLRGEEELLAGLVTKDYVETLGQGRAWTWANISLALTAVDGNPDFCPPIGPDRKEFAFARFRYCTQNWYWPLATYLWARYNALIDRQAEALSRVEDLSYRNLPIPTPSVGSSTDKDDSTPEEPRPVDMQEAMDLLQEDSTE